MSCDRRPCILPALLIVALGIAFLLRNFGVFHGSLVLFWPILLILLGVSLLFGRCRRKESAQ